MNSFEYKLWCENKFMCLRITKQPETLRGKGHLFTSSCGLDVFSDRNPSFYEHRPNEIFVQGNSVERDNDIVKFEICQETVVDMFKIDKTLKEFQNWCNENYPLKQEASKTTVVLVKQGCNNYLFEVPKGYSLKKLDKVICDTMRGEATGVCSSDSIVVNDETLETIIKLLGAYKPLKKVLGVYQEFDLGLPF